MSRTYQAKTKKAITKLVTDNFYHIVSLTAADMFYSDTAFALRANGASDSPPSLTLRMDWLVWSLLKHIKAGELLLELYSSTE